MFPGFTSQDALTVEQVRIAMAAHGMSVVEIERVAGTGQWRVVDSRPPAVQPAGHRAEHQFDLTGPAAGSAWLKTAADPRGRTVDRHAQQLRRRRDAVGHRALRRGELQPVLRRRRRARRPSCKPRLARYGITTTARYPQRQPQVGAGRRTLRPGQAPQRGAPASAGSSRSTRSTRSAARASTPRWAGSSTRAPTSSSPKDGHVVAYMGDDERFDYLYKFVSDKKFMTGDSRAARKHNLTLLESGTLYVAKLDQTSAGEIDGSGTLPADGAFNGTGPVDQAGQRRPVVRRRDDRRRGAHLHPARRRQGRRDQDGPPGGRRAEPASPARCTWR